MRGYFLFIILFFITSCSDKSKSAVDIIPKEKMTRIIWDMMQVDEFASAYVAKDTTKNIRKERMKLYAGVFQLHNVSKEEFSTSFKYYSAKPDIMKVLFDTLGARADRERKNVYMSPDSLK